MTETGKVYAPVTDLTILTRLQLHRKLPRRVVYAKAQYKRLVERKLIIHRGDYLYITVQGLAAFQELANGDGHHYTPYPYGPATLPEPDDTMAQMTLFDEDD